MQTKSQVKAKHTPGPWFPEGTDSQPGRRIYAPNDPTVCEIYDYDTPEGRANAHLIAAAPKLLEALKAQQLQLERLSRLIVQNHIEADLAPYNDAYELAADAIAEAEGRS